MLGNQNLQMNRTLMLQNFTSFLFPHQQYSPFSVQNPIFSTNPSAPLDFNIHKKWNGNFTDNSNAFARTETSPSNTLQSPLLSIPNMVANTSGFNFLPQLNQNFSFAQPMPNNMFSQGTILPLPSQTQPSLNELLKLMASPAAASPIAPPLRSVDMPIFSPLLPGISTTLPSFATLPLVQANDSPKLSESTIYSFNQPTSFYSNLSPPILEQIIPQDPTNSTTFTPNHEMPSSTTFEMPMFPHLFSINNDKNIDIASSFSISAPSSPPVLTRIEDPIQNDDPNPPALKPEVLFRTEKDNDAQKSNKTVADEDCGKLILNETLLLEQEGKQTPADSSTSSLENSLYPLPDFSTSQESLLNNTETSNSDSSALKVHEPRLSLEDEPLLDSLETIKKFSEELNLSEADWLEIMTESRRRKLRPSTQANTVATLTKITKDHKNGRSGRKHRSSGSSEREMKSPKVARMENQYNENESENQAPTSTTNFCQSPISIDIDFYKDGIQNSTPSSSGISSSSNFSERSSKHESKWKVLRRSKHDNTIWLGTQNFEDQKENVCLERISEEQLKNSKQRNVICSKKSPKKIKRIKSNWQPIGKSVDKFVRICNDASPNIQQCYTAIKHRYEQDEVIRVRDCIKVRSAEGLENIGKVMNFYVDDRGYLMASVLWYYTREQIDVVKNPLLIPLHEKELLASRHIDNIACDAIESIAFVLTFNEYCRYITEGQIDSLPICLRPLESQEIWPRGEENYPRRSRLPHEDTPFELVYFARRVYDVKMKRVYVPKLTSSLTLRPTHRTTLTRPIRASSH